MPWGHSSSFLCYEGSVLTATEKKGQTGINLWVKYTWADRWAFSFTGCEWRNLLLSSVQQHTKHELSRNQCSALLQLLNYCTISKQLSSGPYILSLVTKLVCSIYWKWDCHYIFMTLLSSHVVNTNSIFRGIRSIFASFSNKAWEKMHF